MLIASGYHGIMIMGVVLGFKAMFVLHTYGRWMALRSTFQGKNCSFASFVISLFREYQNINIVHVYVKANTCKRLMDSLTCPENRSNMARDQMVRIDSVVAQKSSPVIAITVRSSSFPPGVLAINSTLFNAGRIIYEPPNDARFMTNVPGNQVTMEGSAAMLCCRWTFADFQGPIAFEGP